MEPRVVRRNFRFETLEPGEIVDCPVPGRGTKLALVRSISKRGAKAGITFAIVSPRYGWLRICRIP